MKKKSSPLTHLAKILSGDDFWIVAIFKDATAKVLSFTYGDDASGSEMATAAALAEALSEKIESSTIDLTKEFQAMERDPFEIIVLGEGHENEGAALEALVKAPDFVRFIAHQSGKPDWMELEALKKGLKGENPSKAIEFVETSFNKGLTPTLKEWGPFWVFHGKSKTHQIDLNGATTLFYQRRAASSLLTELVGDPVGVSEVSGETGAYGIEIIDGYNGRSLRSLIILLTPEEIRRFCLKNLQPEEFKTLLEKYGMFFEVHEDFYAPDGSIQQSHLARSYKLLMREIENAKSTS